MGIEFDCAEAVGLELERLGLGADGLADREGATFHVPDGGRAADLPHGEGKPD